jgi:hypothetical protein
MFHSAWFSCHHHWSDNNEQGDAIPERYTESTDLCFYSKRHGFAPSAIHLSMAGTMQGLVDVYAFMGPPDLTIWKRRLPSGLPGKVRAFVEL